MRKRLASRAVVPVPHHGGAPGAGAARADPAGPRGQRPGARAAAHRGDAARALRHRAPGRRAQRDAGAPVARPRRADRAAHPHPRRRRPERDRPRAVRGARRAAHGGAGRHPPLRRRRAVLRPLPPTSATRSASRRPSRSGDARPRWATSCASCATFRPDVVITLPLEAAGGGQHHQAAGRLAEEAFRAAADPARFPEPGLRPWQARKIYQGGVAAAGSAAKARRRVDVRTGVYDPLLGMTLAAARQRRPRPCTDRRARASSWPPRRGRGVLRPARQRARRSPGAEADVLDGLDALLRRRCCASRPATSAARPSSARTCRRSRRAPTPRAPPSIPPLPRRRCPSLQAVLVAGCARCAGKVGASGLDAAARAELVDAWPTRSDDVEAALGLAHGLDLEVAGRRRRGDPGPDVHRHHARRRTWARRRSPLEERHAARAARAGRSRAARGERRASWRPGRRVRLPFTGDRRRERRAVAALLAARRGADRFELVDPALAGRPWAPPDVDGGRCATAAARRRARPSEPAQWRYEWPGGRREAEGGRASGSEFSVRLQPEVTVVPVGGRAPREFRVAVRNERKGPAAGACASRLPAGWTVEPREAPLRFRARARRSRRGSPSRRRRG